VRTLDELIAASPVFAGLDPEDVAFIADCGKNTGFEADELIARDGDPANSFYLLRQGRVAVEMHTPTQGGLVIETLDPGDIVGWAWLFPPYRWHYDVRAIESVRAVAFDGGCLREKCDVRRDLGYELMLRFAQVMNDRLQHTRFRLLDVYGASVAS
jgi:CRP/FNR family cyclic AMP-dependent transcriptional regulator